MATKDIAKAASNHPAKSAGMGGQQKLQSLLMQIQSYQGMLQDIARQAALTEQAIGEMMATIEALEAIPKEKGSEALIPIGSGVFVKGQLKDKEKIILALGASAHIEKTFSEAKSFLEGKRKILEANDARLHEQAMAVNQQLEAMNAEAEQMYAAMQK